MTARARTKMISSAKSIALGAILGLTVSVALADDQQVVSRTAHFIDSSSDRTPAKTAFPTYPKIARRDRIEGDATICFRIDIDGRVKSAKVQSYTHRIFRRPALRAMKDSSFEPLGPDELFSTARTCRTYRFRLEPILADSKKPAAG